MGGEAISANEYFGVGKVTEFRYGTKLKDCINNGDFNCLQGIYDPVGLHCWHTFLDSKYLWLTSSLNKAPFVTFSHTHYFCF